MKMGYSDPLRSPERSMNPEFAQHQMRDPGLRSMRPHMGGMHPPHAGGLGSMHHTMPHLMRRSGTPHFAGGGLGNPTAQMIESTYAPNPAAAADSPDAQYRNFLSLVDQQNLGNSPFKASNISTSPNFMYAEGGEADDEGADDQSADDQSAGPGVEDVESPDEDMSPQGQQQKQIVLNAMAALEGQSPDPEADLKTFIDAFGAHALADLQQLLESKHQEEGDQDDEENGEPLEGEPGEPGEDEDEEEQAASSLQQAGGGLLHGHGTGQSDEIEGVTPSGHPVLLSDGEYVIDAPTVAALGDGSTKAGARRLDEMRKQIRAKAYGHDKQAKPMGKMAKGGGTAVVLRLK